MWSTVGPPLYYCSDCLRSVSVTPIEGGEPIIKRPCDCNAQIIAPRSALLAGEGGLSAADKIRQLWRMIIAALTGRTLA
jgi:hypothetical protein